jgi:hypothetical protein
MVGKTDGHKTRGRTDRYVADAVPILNLGTLKRIGFTFRYSMYRKAMLLWWYLCHIRVYLVLPVSIRVLGKILSK